jgi:hypothetical protein
MDSIYIKNIFRQDLQDIQDYFFVLPHFPEENEETQSAFRRKNVTSLELVS